MFKCLELQITFFTDDSLVVWLYLMHISYFCVFIVECNKRVSEMRAPSGPSRTSGGSEQVAMCAICF